MPLSQSELDDFLAEPHIAVVSTTGPSGKPHAMPIWYAWRDGKVLFHTGAESKKMRNLRKNPGSAWSSIRRRRRIRSW
ncbi:MAG: pyridoxamine 5'-phosphate oxidase family protein [Dehalococcoidia bacterium]|nr:pyridoxamine 5'-phosphate oxidase family protein [Dehalococcoidia bacterium]